MKFLALVFSNLKRKKLRTILTLLSIFVAFLLFGFLSALKEAFLGGVNIAGADRLIVRHKVALIQPLPQSYEAKIESIQGVDAVAGLTWFGGIYKDPKDFIATFPVVVGTAAGLHAADENARMLFRTMGASRLQTLIKLKIPTGLPHIFTGLKIAAIGVVAGAITAEFLGGGTGMGHQIRTAASQLDTPRVFALILYLSILGLATFWSVVWLQQRLVFWHKASSRQDPVA